MEKEHVKKIKTITFTVQVTWLLVGVILLSVLIFVLTEGIAVKELWVQRWLLRMAWLSAALLGLTLVLLLWAVVRYVKFRTYAAQRSRPTPYVDAWALAGKRFQLDDEEEEQDDEPDDTQGGDGS